MHPLLAEQTARVLTEERLRTAAAARRARPGLVIRPGPRDRLGVVLIHMGERLRGTAPARPGAVREPRGHPTGSLARAAGPC